MALDPGVSPFVDRHITRSGARPRSESIYSRRVGALREGAPRLYRKDPRINPGVAKFTLNVMPGARKLVLTAYVGVF